MACAGEFAACASDIEARLRERLEQGGAFGADLDEGAAAAAARLHEDAAAFRAEMAGSEADLDGFVERTLAAIRIPGGALPPDHPVRRALAGRRRDPGGPMAGYSGAI